MDDNKEVCEMNAIVYNEETEGGTMLMESPKQVREIVNYDKSHTLSGRHLWTPKDVLFISNGRRLSRSSPTHEAEHIGQSEWSMQHCAKLPYFARVFLSLTLCFQDIAILPFQRCKAIIFVGVMAQLSSCDFATGIRESGYA